jgi:pyruvate,water dikinase
MQEAEVHAATSFEQLTADPRLSLRKTARWRFGWSLILLFARTRLPWYLFAAFLAPKAESRRVQRFVEHLRTAYQIDMSADAATHLAEASHLLLHCLRPAFRVSPVMVAGMQSFALARGMLGDLASESECQVVLRGSPVNPTTQMNLALWWLAQEVRADETSKHLLQSAPTEGLVQGYRQGQLPTPLQQGLTRFLLQYGHQGICELDVGVPRWSEDPTYVVDLLTSYLEEEENTHTPDLQLQRAEREARAMIATLSRRAGKKHRFRGQLVRFLLQRAHALAGFREMTRFVIGLPLSHARQLLWLVGEELAKQGRLKEATDIFFLTFPEAQAALAGADFRPQVGERQATFARELGRRHVPLVLLSDGTEPAVRSQEMQSIARTEGMLQGTPASAGHVTASARVILDPHVAHLEPGEILVAPSTDPGWTPLFLQASGLVMDVGGAMAHGAIVAREYGIPAVVGVASATKQIKTGNRITIDGTTGTVVIESSNE